MTKFINLKTSPNRVEFTGDFSIEDEGLYLFFKQHGAGEYDHWFGRALRLGAYALEEERIAAFLGRAENEIDAGLERLKVIYKMVHLKEKSAAKGAVAEIELSDVLHRFIDKNGWSDEVAITGNAQGLITDRKVGDLVCSINNGAVSVVVESKMNASVGAGDPTTLDERNNKNPDHENTAYGQNITSLVNRGAQVAITVFDKENCSAQIQKLEGITFQPELPGFIVKVDIARGDFANICLAYSIAREMALMGVEKIHGDHLNLVIKRLVRDLGVLAETEANLGKIENAARDTLKVVESIRGGIADTTSSLKSSSQILKKVLAGDVPSLDEMRLYFNEKADK